MYGGLHAQPEWFFLGVRDPRLTLSGFSGQERDGRWSDGETCSVEFPVRSTAPCLIVVLHSSCFVHKTLLPSQRVHVSANDRSLSKWTITDGRSRRRILGVDRSQMEPFDRLTIKLTLPDSARPSEIGLNADGRKLGIFLSQIEAIGVDRLPSPRARCWTAGNRTVGFEASKTCDDYLLNGFWDAYVKGPKVLDIGFKGYSDGVKPILEGAIGVDLDYPGYDGHTLPFPDNSQDAVFSSHCLEHIPDPLIVMRDWHRVTKVGGHIIIAVPSMHLYERRKRPPSRLSGEHWRFYSPGALLAELESALEPGSYRVRSVIENDRDYDYDLPPEEHPRGCYEIVAVIEKTRPARRALA
ncbi:MAG: class I SAM-dependent methyltransferase [Hyphomicrobiales bacterium]|nr:class I SAM-dependent methyltransferase [Hyphomicrobiales bacterium]